MHRLLEELCLMMTSFHINNYPSHSLSGNEDAPSSHSPDEIGSFLIVEVMSSSSSCVRPPGGREGGRKGGRKRERGRREGRRKGVREGGEGVMERGREGERRESSFRIIFPNKTALRMD